MGPLCECVLLGMSGRREEPMLEASAHFESRSHIRP